MKKQPLFNGLLVAAFIKTMSYQKSAILDAIIKANPIFFSKETIQIHKDRNYLIETQEDGELILVVCNGRTGIARYKVDKITYDLTYTD